MNTEHSSIDAFCLRSIDFARDAPISLRYVDPSLSSLSLFKSEQSLTSESEKHQSKKDTFVVDTTSFDRPSFSVAIANYMQQYTNEPQY